ncbi:hypothetical protein [Nocardioides aquiterrae]|uniref:Uncharacterized protein n=1 Tax=Nocardioides aquiterrae TaxID=203799 RepID=A0ABP4F3I6_9ACTN
MRRTAVPAALAALALLAGCGGSDDPAPTPAPSSGSTDPSGSASSPSADVATGIRLTQPNSTVVAPEAWTRGRTIVSGETSADSPDHLAWVSLGEIEAFGSDQDAEQLGHTRIASDPSPRKPKLLPVAELDGRPAYHVAGWVGGSRYIDEYGAIWNDRIVSLVFSFNEKVPAAERTQVVEQVLPTFQWK